MQGWLGIIGEEGRIENCHNYAKISAPDYVGGIVGYINNNSKMDKIINCSNNGNIVCTATTKSPYLGGIVGNTDSTTLIIENCFNKGEIEGSGITGNSKGYIKNSYNVGDVSYGLVCANQGKIANCYSIGNSNSKYLVNNNNYTDSYMYNCTYLINTAVNVAKNNTETSIDKLSCLGIESYEMKEDSFLNNLNQNLEGTTDIWIKDIKNINEGYPILSWQNTN